jgi:REP-associated tyrosine transposase
MPRGPRLDTPGALHHVIARGIERRDIFVDDVDCEGFLARLATLVDDGSFHVCAWALMPNHVHLLLRTAARPLERSMRALLAGYAGAFNRRHSRVGHLFQNRYKSILCEQDAYLLTLVRYIHLNPVKALLVPDLASLARFPYTGHSALMGFVERPWQRTIEVLHAFSNDAQDGIRHYEEFIAAGLLKESEEDLDGGGLARSRCGWKHVGILTRGRERFTSDERILGTSEFVRGTLLQVKHSAPATAALPETIDLEKLVQLVCKELQLPPRSIREAGRARDVSRARAGLAFLWTSHLGRSARELALRLGLAPSSVIVAARRGRKEAERWLRLISLFEQSNKS